MIRPLTEFDLSSLVLLESRGQLFPWSEDIFKLCFKSGYFGFGLEDESGLMGFILLSFQASEAHVLNLCIHPDYQRRGLGYQLLIYALNQLRANGGGVVYLEVRCSNAPAIALYQKIGFVEVAVRPGYYPALHGREDAYLFAKDLSLDDE